MSSRILWRMALKRRWGTATSAIWNVTYLAEDTTSAPILMSLSRSVVNDQWLTPPAGAGCL